MHGIQADGSKESGERPFAQILSKKHTKIVCMEKEMLEADKLKKIVQVRPTAAIVRLGLHAQAALPAVGKWPT